MPPRQPRLSLNKIDAKRLASPPACAARPVFKKDASCRQFVANGVRRREIAGRARFVARRNHRINLRVANAVSTGITACPSVTRLSEKPHDGGGGFERYGGIPVTPVGRPGKFMEPCHRRRRVQIVLQSVKERPVDGFILSNGVANGPIQPVQDVAGLDKGRLRCVRRQLQFEETRD